MTKINLGKAPGGAGEIDLETLLRTRLLIQANSGGGKSWLLRRLAEQAFGKVQVIIIDPEGEFATLREHFGYVLVGKGGETPADVRSAALVAHKLLELNASAVCGLFEMKDNERHTWVRIFLDAMVNAPKKLWHPVLVIVDEAQMFCPEKGQGESEASGAMVALTTRGRKRGYCAVWATQRLSNLNKNATSMLLNRLVGMTFEDVDMERVIKLLSVTNADKMTFTQEMQTLEPGCFYGLGRAISKTRVMIRIGAVATTHPELGAAGTIEPPAPPEKIRKLLPSLADLPQMAEAKARTEADLRREIADLKKQLVQRPAAEAKIETVNVLDPGQVGVLRNAIETLGPLLAKHSADFGSHLRMLNDAVQPVVTALDKAGKNAPAAAPRLAPSRPFQIAAKTTEGKTVPAGSPALAQAIGDRTRKQQAILDVLAWLERMGIQPALRTQVALLTDQSPTSSAYTNNLGALRTAGMIAYPNSGTLGLTDAGLSDARPDQIQMSTDGLQAALLAKLPRKQAAILRVLIEHYPQAVDRDELASLADNQSPTSSAYTNNLGALRTLGVIDYPTPKRAVALAVLFLEG